METRTVSGNDLVRIADKIIAQAADQQDPLALLAAVVIGGDRIRYCDEGIVFIDEPLRGLVTIAPMGEDTADPTIVGIFVCAADRGHGYGLVLFEAAIQRCLERGFAKIRVDLFSKGAKRLVEKLPDDRRQRLDVYDLSHMSPF